MGSAMKFKAKRSFTILEIMIAVLIVGMITAFGIPKYQRAMENAQRAEAFDNLRIIHAAEQAYRAGTGHYWPTDGANHLITEINQNLRLNIIENGAVYSCTGNGTTFTCTVTKVSYPTVQVNQNALGAGNPF
jgi:type II secretory pathway pseudopilin PulG